MGRIERPPSWILKYKERIEQGKITVEGILEEENKIRELPIKISSVTRAINALGHPITGMRREKMAEVREGEADGTVESGEKREKIEKGPGWLQKYHERIENGTITVDEILEEENKIRELPIKRSSVTRAVNAMGYPITGIRSGKMAEAREGEAEGTVESGEKRERIEKGPGWLQKYYERIGNGTITVDEILEEENKIREIPIKIATVKRAVNALGHPITGMRRGKMAEVREGEAEGIVESGEKRERIEKGPGWLQKYYERIVNGTITVDEILEEENKIREVPIKISSVTRAVNALGHPITGMRKERGKEANEVEKIKKAGEAEAVVYSSSIGNLSAATAKRFNEMKKSWEEDLDKSLHNDYFVNILLALAKLAEHGQSLAPVNR
jgi:DNA-binding FrmR family transcriptional regulator